MSFRSVTVDTRLLRKVSISGFAICMCCRASAVLDTELIGLGQWPVGSTAAACDFPRGAPGAQNSLTLNCMVSSIGGVRKSMSGPVGAGGVTAGTTSGVLSISDKVVKPADILFLNLLCDDMFERSQNSYSVKYLLLRAEKRDLDLGE